jgi:hypothetical protein
MKDANGRTDRHDLPTTRSCYAIRAKKKWTILTCKDGDLERIHNKSFENRAKFKYMGMAAIDKN